MYEDCHFPLGLYKCDNKLSGKISLIGSIAFYIVIETGHTSE